MGTTTLKSFGGLCKLALAAVACSLLLASCGGGGGGGDEGGPVLGSASSSLEGLYLDAMDPGNWEIGPVIGGTSYSTNMPLHPSPYADGQVSGWVIELPQPTSDAGSVNYVTMETGSLAGKTMITMRYRVEADPGVEIVPKNFPDFPSLLTLYFQRQGDDWSARGSYEAFRWYAAFSRHMPIQPGEYTIQARFDQNWTAVLTSSRQNNPSAFQDALVHAGRIGFVLGGGDGAGHGVYATGPARIIVTSFEVE